MKRTTFLLLSFALLIPACKSNEPTPMRRAQPATTVRPSAAEAESIGKRIWANECAGSVQGLVSWNEGEAFPSLGIGHFIWYPAGVHERFEESLPSLVVYARRSGVSVPAIFNGPAPWPNKAAFLADKSGRADAMRRWLAANTGVQTDYIIHRLNAALPSMMAHSRNPQAVKAHYLALAATAQGKYCLADYVNFKGEGIKESERYNGQGWGLLQVLEEMRGNPQGREATAEFSRAAALMMRRRVDNSPAARGEQRWLPGWLNRCASYR